LHLRRAYSSTRTGWNGSIHYAEQRWITIGLVDGVEIAVAYTVRGEAIRLISARKAERHEREDYWKR
jgi:uncharacterized DUF497 family protein